MAEAKIITKDGINIQIKGEATEIKSIIDFIGKHKVRAKKTNTIAKKSKKISVLGKIRELISNGFFDKPKSISEIAKHLGTLGYTVSLEKLSPRLLALIRNGELKRSGLAGAYKYTRGKSKTEDL